MKPIQFLLPSLFCLCLSACDATASNTSVDLGAFKKKVLSNMVFVKGGTFMMGDAGTMVMDYNIGKKVHRNWTPYSDARPVHKVTLDSYYISKYETTWEEYDRFAEATKREKRQAKYIGKKEWRGPNYPASADSWYAAKAECKWLGKITNLPIDLPTEAQWEYAARSRGQNVGYATDNGLLEEGRNVRGPKHGRFPTAVGTFPPNPLGLYDMAGNMGEWVNDWYAKYNSSPQVNPKGPKTGTKKIYRGGKYYESPVGWDIYVREEKKPKLNGGISGGWRCAIHTDKPLQD
jgi:formylglycine-generating enzyme required for sulfatase activity